MSNKKLGPSGLGKVWIKIFELIQIVTGDVDVAGKGDLQTQIENLQAGMMETDGDSAENTVAFTSNDAASPTAWTDVEVLKSGEKHRGIFNKVSTMFKNIRYLYKVLGSTDISKIGDGTVTGGISTLSANLSNKANRVSPVLTDSPTIQFSKIGDGTYSAELRRMGPDSAGNNSVGFVLLDSGNNPSYESLISTDSDGNPFRGWVYPAELTNAISTHTHSNFVKSGSGAKAGLVPAPSTTAGTTKYLREDGTWQVPPNTVYSHPTTSGNKHIPSGGSSGQILRWSADGTAAWGADNNTTYSNFVKSGSGAKAGLVPAPSTTAGTTKYLREDGTWQVPPNTNTTYSAGTGISLSGTTFSNSGVRSIASGSSNGTISVNTNGTTANVAVKGLGAAAYRGVDTTPTSGSSNLITSSAVSAKANSNDPTLFFNFTNTSGLTQVQFRKAGNAGSQTLTLVSTVNGSDIFNNLIGADGKISMTSPRAEGGLQLSSSNRCIYTDNTTLPVFISCTTSPVNSLGTAGSYRFETNQFQPGTNNSITCGSTNYRWKQVFTATACNTTSDRNLKENINPLTDIHYQFFLELLPVSFTFKDGDSGRTHIGFISQDVEDAMNELGMSSLDFAGFCKDVKVRHYSDENNNEIEETVLDNNGNPEYIYSLRYEEFIALITDALQRTIKRLDGIEERLVALESV